MCVIRSDNTDVQSDHPWDSHFVTAQTPGTGTRGYKDSHPDHLFKESHTFPRSLWLFDLRAVTGLEAKLIRAIGHSETPTLSPPIDHFVPERRWDGSFFWLIRISKTFVFHV
jgi:hypothetical protein